SARDAPLEHPGSEPRGERRRGVEPEAAAADRGDGDRGHAEERPFHRRRHRARVRHVVTEVRAFVDAREDERWAPAEDAVDGEVHAVRGCTVDGVAARTHLLDAERTVQGERVTHRTALPVGRYDDDVAERLDGGGE